MILSLLAGCGRAGKTVPDDEAFWWPERILTHEERRQEVLEKRARVVSLLKQEGVSGVLIASPECFSWLTAGIVDGVPLFAREDGKVFLVAGSAAGRNLLDEELKGMDFELREVGPFDASLGPESPILRELSRGRPFAADSQLPGTKDFREELAALRSRLTPAEAREYRWLGTRTAEMVEAVCRKLRRGMNERAVEEMLSRALLRHAIRPVAIELASDDRIREYGAVPAGDERKIGSALQVSVCAQRWGLHVSLTRAVHFGPPPEGLQADLRAAASVNAGFWARTRTGASAGSILQGAVSDYLEARLPDEWRHRDLGGAIGYRMREWSLPAGGSRAVGSLQAFAWRASVRGVRVEDTILVDGENLEILTRTPEWPAIESSALGRVYRSAAILPR